MTAPSLIAQKVRQAQQIMQEEHLDCWIVQFGQETGNHPDPVQSMLVGTDITWLSAFIIPAQGEPTAIVGSLDVEKVRAVGAYPAIIGYVQGIADPLRAWLDQIKPTSIGITTSTSDAAADGLTYGNYQRLKAILRGTPYAKMLRSAEGIVRRVRGVKLAEEVERIRAACQLTGDLFAEISALVRPGVTGLAISDFAHRWIQERGLEPAWEANSCPCVPIGPRSPVGHVPAGDIPAEPGDLIFCDVGVVFQGYRSDMQRTWYILRDGEDQPPANVQHAWSTLMRAVHAGANKLAPGAVCWQVDAAARKEIVRGGYDEPSFAFGHHLGANAHDGGGVLGPRWERYGRAPYYLVEVGQVYATEYAVPTRDPYVGYVSVEDDVLVTPNGAEWLVPPQREIWLKR